MTNDHRNNGPETGRDERGRFGPGNPRRPKGARHKATILALTLLEDEAEALTRKAIELAMAGDTTALRLALERIAPPRREAPVPFAIAPMKSAADAAAAVSGILDAVASGEVTPGEGAVLAGLVEQYRKALETTELEVRIGILEERYGKP